MLVPEVFESSKSIFCDGVCGIRVKDNGFSTTVITGSVGAYLQWSVGSKMCWDCGVRVNLKGPSWAWPLSEGFGLLFAEGEIRRQAAYESPIESSEETVIYLQSLSVLHVNPPIEAKKREEGISVLIAVVEADLSESELDLHVAWGASNTIGEKIGEKEGNKETVRVGAIVVDSGDAKVTFVVQQNSDSVINGTVIARRRKLNLWSLTEPLKVKLANKKWWDVVRVDGLVQGAVYDIDSDTVEKEYAEMQVGENGPVLLSRSSFTTTTISQPVWLTVKNPFSTSTEFTLSATKLTPKRWDNATKEVSVPVPAGASVLATMEVSAGVDSILREALEDKTDVSILYARGSRWPDRMGREGTDMKSGMNLELGRYNFRIYNKGRVDATVKLAFVGSDVGEGTESPEAVSGMDALAMFVCVIFVFVIFTILASFTLRKAESAGRLVVEDDNLE